MSESDFVRVLRHVFSSAFLVVFRIALSEAQGDTVDVVSSLLRFRLPFVLVL